MNTREDAADVAIYDARKAELAGAAQGYLSDLERGRRQGTPETLTRIAAALDVPAKWLVG